MKDYEIEFSYATAYNFKEGCFSLIKIKGGMDINDPNSDEILSNGELIGNFPTREAANKHKLEIYKKMTWANGKNPFRLNEKNG